jgi:pimeloyl-ACP methyl ester carboxylesterase
MAVPPLAAMASSFFSYGQLKRSFYIFVFQTPLAETAVSIDGHSFIDGLWADWSPGYDGAWDVARVKESIGDPEHMLAAITYYRALYQPELQVPELADEQAAILRPTPKPTLYLHGRDDNCMLLSSISSDPLTFLAEGSAMEVVDSAGHFLHVEAPDVVNAHIVDFLTA